MFICLYSGGTVASVSEPGLEHRSGLERVRNHHLSKEIFFFFFSFSFFKKCKEFTCAALRFQRLLQLNHDTRFSSSEGISLSSSRRTKAHLKPATPLFCFSECVIHIFFCSEEPKISQVSCFLCHPQPSSSRLLLVSRNGILVWGGEELCVVK